MGFFLLRLEFLLVILPNQLMEVLPQKVKPCQVFFLLYGIIF